MESSVSKKEKINRPNHYCEGRSIEPIDAIDDWDLGFCLGNALKYISRAGRKESADMGPIEKHIEDLEKAMWYIEREVSKRRKEKQNG